MFKPESQLFTHFLTINVRGSKASHADKFYTQLCSLSTFIIVLSSNMAATF